MIFGGTATQVLDYSLMTVQFIGKSQIKKNIEKLQKDLDTMGESAVENGMKINTGQRKAIRYTGARVKNPLSYSLGEKKFRKQVVVNTWE